MICKSHEKFIQTNNYDSMYCFFDISPEQVRKVFREHIRDELFEVFLPEWEGRVELRKKNGQEINRD
jgi:hypothetical protein